MTTTPTEARTRHRQAAREALVRHARADDSANDRANALLDAQAAIDALWDLEGGSYLAARACWRMDQSDALATLAEAAKAWHDWQDQRETDALHTAVENLRAVEARKPVSREE